MATKPTPTSPYTAPSRRPVSSSWARSTTPTARSVDLVGRERPLAALDLHHHQGLGVEPRVVLAGEIEHPGDADEAGALLQVVADLLLVGADRLEGVRRQAEGVPRVAGEGRRRVAELGLVAVDEGVEDGLLGVGVGQLAGDQQPADGEDHAVGRGAGRVEEGLVADAVALHQRGGDLQLAVALGGDTRGRRDAPDEVDVGLGVTQRQELVVEAGGVGRELGLLDDLDALAGAGLVDQVGHALAEGGGVTRQPDRLPALEGHVGDQLVDHHAVVLRRLVDPLGAVDDLLVGRQRDHRRLRLLGPLVHCQAGARAGGAEDQVDLGLVDQARLRFGGLVLLDWSSSTVSSILRPAMPPSPLTLSVMSWRVLRSGPPREAPAPVMSSTAPILIGPELELEPPPEDFSSEQAAASRARTRMATSQLQRRTMTMLPPAWGNG